jgi:hypothetical protein
MTTIHDTSTTTIGTLQKHPLVAILRRQIDREITSMHLAVLNLMHNLAITEDVAKDLLVSEMKCGVCGHGVSYHGGTSGCRVTMRNGYQCRCNVYFGC